MKLLFFIVPMVFAASAADNFELEVSRSRILSHQLGTLRVDAQAVTFQSRDGKTRITIPLRDLREAAVADPRALRFETYDRREQVFRARSDAPVEELAKFLTAHVHRPVVGHYPEGARFRAAAYHRRALGGTSGMLEIGDDGIQFVSEKPVDSRTWLYRDIETIGRPDSYRFRVTTNRETYVLELKEDLPAGAYEFAWNKVYRLEGRTGGAVP